MGDSKLEIRDNTVYEIRGNLAFESVNETKWEAGKFKLAFIGRVCTEKDGFFRGYLMKLFRLNTLSSLGGIEVPVIGRFIKGRNDSTTIIFATIDDTDGTRLWIKKKVDEGFGYGIITDPCFYGGEKWVDNKMGLSGYIQCEVFKAVVNEGSEDDKKALVTMVSTAYSCSLNRWRNRDENKKQAEAFIENYDSIENALLDLLDKHEGVIASTAKYPDEK